MKARKLRLGQASDPSGQAASAQDVCGQGHAAAADHAAATGWSSNLFDAYRIVKLA
jgi:hypothetical protein